MYRFLVFLLMLISAAKAGERPNFLIIMADDCNYNDLPVYGGENAMTPNIDSLAKSGLVFNQAYVAEAMCMPCRSELYTGLYPFSNGSAWNHSGSYEGITSMPQDLGKQGYRVGLTGKIHVRPRSVYPFKLIEGFDPKCGRSPTLKQDTKGIEAFMADKKQPFCLMVCLVEPHRPWTMGDSSKYPVDKLKLPPYLADTKPTREAFSNYLAEVTYMDSQVGDVLKSLEKSGQKDNTIVIFTSEQGAQFPGGKWTNYDVGLHTAFIASWPGKIPVNKRTDALIQYADVLPTFMDIAGAENLEKYDGTSFKDVLMGIKSNHREYVYGIHNNAPEGPSYPIRSISNGKFRYIMNLRPERQFIVKHMMGIDKNGVNTNKYWGTWLYEATENEEIFNLVQRFTNRPAEELYHTAKDKYELSNEAENPEYQALKANLKKELKKWLAESGDPGIELDTPEARLAAREDRHIYKPNNK